MSRVAWTKGSRSWSISWSCVFGEYFPVMPIDGFPSFENGIDGFAWFEDIVFDCLDALG